MLGSLIRKTPKTHPVGLISGVVCRVSVVHVAGSWLVLRWCWYISTGVGWRWHSVHGQERARRTHPQALAPRTRQEWARRTHPLALAQRTRQEQARHPLALTPRVLLALTRRDSLLAKTTSAGAMYSTTGAGGAPLFRLTCRPSKNFPKDFTIKLLHFSNCAWAILSQNGLGVLLWLLLLF